MLIMSTELILGLLAVGIYLLIRYLNSTDVPRIKGPPEVPGVPIFGNLFQLGSYHHVAAQELAKKYGPVFQVRMGNRRAIFVNTFESAKDIWISQQTAMMSRQSYTHSTRSSLVMGKRYLIRNHSLLTPRPRIRRARTGRRQSLPR